MACKREECVALAFGTVSSEKSSFVRVRELIGECRLA